MHIYWYFYGTLCYILADSSTPGKTIVYIVLIQIFGDEILGDESTPSWKLISLDDYSCLRHSLCRHKGVTALPLIAAQSQPQPLDWKGISIESTNWSVGTYPILSLPPLLSPELSSHRAAIILLIVIFAASRQNIEIQIALSFFCNEGGGSDLNIACAKYREETLSKTYDENCHQ